ncbi:MAG TPA: cytochrome c oxidase assembly factor Coa1 family protein [Thermoanaerobaculia bacterium]|jgi:hypothetical protein
MSEYRQQPDVVPRTNWFARNWKWLVPAGCLLFIVGIGVFVVAIAGVAFTAVKNSTPYGDALRIAQANPELAEALGTPMETGWSNSGTIRLNNDDGFADITVPLTGPKGKAKLQVRGTKTDGKWTYDILRAEVEGGKTVDLLERAAHPTEP